MKDLNTFFTKYWLLVLSIAITIVTVIFIFHHVKPNHEWALSWESDPMSILLKISAGLIISAALLDQFIAVFFPEKEEVRNERFVLQSSIKETRRRSSEMKSRFNEAKLEKMRSNGTPEFASMAADLQKDVNKEEDNLLRLQENRTKIDGTRTIRVRRIAFVVGLTLSLSGVSVLSHFVNFGVEIKDYHFHHWLILWFDMIVTACLLSGGTSGVHQFITMLKNKLNEA